MKTVLAEYLKKMRHTRGMTQVQISKTLGITARGYRSLEAGEHCISGPTLARLLLFLEPSEREELLAALARAF